MAKTISALEGARAGYGFVRSAWRGAFGALAVSALATASYIYALNAGLGRGAVAMALLFTLAASVVSQGALLRLALKLDGVGPGGLQWKRLETRLLGLTLLTAVLFTVIVLVLGIVLLCISLGLSMAGGGRAVADDADWLASLGVPGALMLGLVAMGGLAFIIWLSIRLCLAPAVTAVLGRIQLLSTFDYTKGKVWPILGAFVLAAAPMLAVGFVSGLFQGASQNPTLGLVLGVLSGAVGSFVYAPAAAGLVAYLYERLVAGRKA